MKSGLYVGLLSGTSMDGADAALIECAGDSTTLVHALTLNYPDSLNSRISQAIGEFSAESAASTVGSSTSLG